MELSVIIVSYNVSHYLKLCIQSVIKASEKTDCEILIVDNNSSDDSCTMIEQDYPEILLIRNTTNPGFSAANNQAIKLAKGRYILLLNPDTFVDNDTFVECIRFMDLHSDAGALGVRMINGEGRYLPESKRAFPSVGTAFFKTFGLSHLFPDSKIFNRYYLTHIDSFKTSKTEVISGAFMFIRKEALIKSGPLDEDFFMYGEDIDLSFRLLKSGYNNYYFADTQIIHYKGKSTDRNGFTDILHFYKAMRIYVRKRAGESKYYYWHILLMPGIYFREVLALLNRFIRIITHR